MNFQGRLIPSVFFEILETKITNKNLKIKLPYDIL